MRESFITTNGVKLRVLQDGPENAPLVVLLHGFPEHAYSWRHQIPALVQAGFHIVAPDQRGYNLSDKPPRVSDYALDVLTQDIVGLIRALGREDAVVVGHDWGGAVAYRLAMDYPQMTRKLVILNAPHPRAVARAQKNPGQVLRFWYILAFQIPWLPETILNLAPMFWARFFYRRGAVNRQAFSDDDLRIYAQANSHPRAMRSMINWYRAALRFPPKNRTRKITAPTLVIWSENDWVLPKELTYDSAGWFGEGYQIEYVPHCGHWVQNEESEKVNRFLVGFCRA